ncbi:MAG: C40 family peptidase [Gemmatimonadaceae bacterium]
MTAFQNTIRRNIKLFAAALGAGVLAAPLSAQTTNQITLTAPRPVPAPKPFARLSASAQGLRDSLVALTRLQLGVPYRLGQSSPEDGFDCSGLAKYVMARFGARLPRTSHEQALAGKKIERNVAALKPGDLLTFGHGRRVSHVAIYIGNGRYVHAPVPGSTVREESLANTKRSWWKGARRVIALDDPSGADSVLN